ncbi:CoA ester lyase [Paraferrimonas sp. SM1919]|uniref:HpcH/HpaI aldolase/citrate lyase family protein n=1 Tax=Paraferrimonas sp. SM1919 TaxID=2662263 RepID=UPI0013D2ACF2|nr:CoA ester lyase [Paraferrimonas sp. SM1919]
MALIRSLLFVPGNRPQRFAKAYNAGSDLICIDLEDAVPLADKNQAREQVQAYIENQRDICVRINPLDSEEGLRDLEALAKAPPTVIMLAKCQSAQQVEQANRALAATDCQIIPLIESIAGLENAKDIASCDNLKAMMFGGADMASELRCAFSYEPLLMVRSQLVLAAAKYNIDLIDVPFIDVKDEQGLLEETRKVRALGFTGKAAIHPKQLAGIHQGFLPSVKQLEFANEVIAAFEKSQSSVLVIDGKMIDKPIIEACQRHLALAQAAAKDGIGQLKE